MGDDATVFVVAGDLIPKERYVSAEFLALELERLWSRVWQVACRAEEVAAPGDYATYEIGDESVVVMREADDAIHAFHNACLHRGTRLLEGFGNVGDGSIHCPFHAWRYDLDGRLVEIVDAADFGPVPDDLALAPVQVDSWGGFVFVNLDADAEPLAEFLDPLPRLLAPYHLDEMRLRAYRSTVLPANWKVVVDAFNEAYHVQGTHPQLLPWTDDVSIAYEQLGKHSHYGRLPHARRVLRPSPRLGLADSEWDEGQILAGMVEGLGGAFLADEREVVKELRAANVPRGELLGRYQQRRMELLRSRGFDVSGFDVEQMTSADDVFWFPNLVGPVYPGSAILFRVRPNGLDPNSAIKDTWVLEWPRPDEPWHLPEPRVFLDWRERDWGVITNQDYTNMLEVQTGMKAKGFTGLRLNPRQECNVLHMHRVIDGYLQR